MSAMKLVCMFVVLAVLAVSVTVEAKPQDTAPANLPDNPKTAECPNGEEFWQACNACGCILQGDGKGSLDYCTRAGCLGWKCPSGDDLRGACGEKCTCDSDTIIMTCEKKCPATSFTVVKQRSKPTAE